MLDRAQYRNLAGVAPVPGARDLRLDFFRGLALVMIFVNHVPGTAFESLTNRNFGFSDAAEGFVMMSGIAAGLAYSRGFAQGPLWPAIAKVWARARTLYFVHIATTMMAIGVFAFAARYFGLFDLLNTINLKPLMAKPLGVFIGLPTLGHQLGYFNILPLYLVLLLAAPLFFLIGLKRPLTLLGLSVLLWVAAGQFRLNFPNYPNTGGWFFNPFSWQLIFVVGLLTGMALKRGARFVPRDPRLLWASIAVLVGTLIWMKIPPIGQALNHGLAVLKAWGVPFYVTDFDKTFVSLPRLVHIMALAYFLSAQGWVIALANHILVDPVRMMGRHALPVFATGSVLCILLQAVRAGIETSILADGLLLAGGLGVQITLAYGLEANRRAATRKTVRPADDRVQVEDMPISAPQR